MTAQTEKQIAEIHAAVVRGTPATEDLLKAAKAVVDALDNSKDWHDLKWAIAELAVVLERRK